MSQLFKVLFSGSLRPGVRTDDAVREFAAVFKVDEAQADALIRSGRERVLKSDVDEANAERYKAVLNDIGLEARVEPEADASGSAMTGGAAGDASGAVSGANTSRVGQDDPAPPRSPTSAPVPPRVSPSAPPSLSKGQPSASAPAGQPGSRTAGPRARPASHGWNWIKQAWAQFKQQPRGWLLAVAIVYLLTFILSMVPLIGSLASIIIGPIFAGGLMLGAQAQRRTGVFETNAALRGFSARGGQLALIGVFYFLGLLAVVLVAALLAMLVGGLTPTALEAINSSDPQVIAATLGPSVLLFALVVMLFLVPLLMAYWFAPALVVLDDMSALEAMRASFSGCLKNVLPFLIYGLMLFLILLVFSLVFALLTGVLVAVSEALAVVVAFLMIPLMLAFASLVILSVYTSYREVFHDDQGASGALIF